MEHEYLFRCIHHKPLAVQVYLASESEEESETEASKGANLRKLLLAGSDDEGGDGNGDSFFLNDGSDDDDDDANEQDSDDEDSGDEDRIADFEKGWANAGPQADDEIVHEVKSLCVV